MILRDSVSGSAILLIKKPTGFSLLLKLRYHTLTSRSINRALTIVFTFVNAESPFRARVYKKHEKNTKITFINGKHFI